MQNGSAPDGPVVPDEDLVARVANDMYRSGWEMLDAAAAEAGRYTGLGMLSPGPPARGPAPGAPAAPAQPPRPAPDAHGAFAPLHVPLDASAAPALDCIEGLRRAFDIGADTAAAAAEPVQDAQATAVDDGSGLYFMRDAAVAATPSAAPPTAAPAGYDVRSVRSDFPALHQRVNERPLVWLDNAATTHKPQSVIDAVADYYARDNSNIHRGAHALAARATDAYEAARATVASFIAAPSPEEIVFVRGTTEAINLVAGSYGNQMVGPGTEIVLTTLEHHSNIVPWKLLADRTGARLRVVPITDRGEIVLEDLERILSPATRIVAVTQVSNALGTVLPISTITAMAHQYGAPVLVDGAQAVPHMPVDVTQLGADFYAFSGHKLFGPTGIGALWGRRELLESMPPWQGGGQMIKTVTFDHVTYNDIPYKFEAGTGIIAGAIGLAAAIDYVSALGMDAIHENEQALLAYGTDLLGSIPGVQLIGTAPVKAGVMSFVIAGLEVEDIGRFLDGYGIALRAGHHCAQPSLRHFGLESTVRPSLALYNTYDDLDVLAHAVGEIARRAR